MISTGFIFSPLLMKRHRKEVKCMNTWDRLSKRSRRIVVVTTIARVLLLWLACAFMSGFAMAIITGLVSLTAEQIAILDCIISTVAGTIWIVAAGVHVFKVYMMYTEDDD